MDSTNTPVASGELLRLFFVVFVGGMAMIATCNVSVNPTAEFSVNGLRPIVSTIRARKVSALTSRPDRQQDNFILGSSRVMKIEPAFVSSMLGGATYNAGVYSARGEDYFVWLRYLLDNGYRPKRLIVGVDVEAFHNTDPVRPRLMSLGKLVQYLDWSDKLRGRIDAVARATSLQGVQMSLRSIGYTLTQYPEDKNLLLSDDGYMIELHRETRLADGTYDFKRYLEGHKADYVKLYRGYSGMGPGRIEYFRRFLKLARDNRMELWVYITPMHPEMIRHLEKHTAFRARYREVARLLERLAAQDPMVHFKDCGEVILFGGDAADFYDGSHPMTANNRRILHHLLRTP